MPRVSLRRAFLYFGAVAVASLLLVAIHAPEGTFIPISPSGLRRAATGYPERPVLVVLDDQQGNHPNSGSGPFGGGRDLQQRHSIESGSGVAGESDSKLRNGQGDSDKSKLNRKDEDPPDQRRLYVKEILTSPIPSNHTIILPHQRPWFMKGGQRMPEVTNGERKLLLWPNEDKGDRIPAQLMYKPPPPPPQDVDHPDVGDPDRSQPDMKKILMYNGVNSWSMKPGRGQFLKLKCPVDTCVLTGSRNELSSADAVVYKDHFTLPQEQRDSNQVWIMYMLECPLHTQHFSHANVFNWTATYRHDSDLVAPYERWVYHDPLIKQMDQPVNYSANKTKQVAWFVSNCGARNNRLQYAKELGRYIGVDIYGACGTKRCPRSSSTRCFDMLNKDYKFYLAFENSNCRDYITEKFFVNGLSHHILPIVMGAHPDDYARAAPYKSYIHVDDFASPKDLADYLLLLDQNPDLYNEYFRWKGTGEFINTFFMCRLCGLLHDETHAQHYQDINLWWRGEGTCISGSWRTHGKMNAAGPKNSSGTSSAVSFPALKPQDNLISDSRIAADAATKNRKKYTR